MSLGKNTNITAAIKTAISNYMRETGSDREDIASQLGIMKGTLDNKLKPSFLESTFTVEEVLAICEITGDDSILKSLCAERGLIVTDPINSMPDGGDVITTMLIGTLDIDAMTGSLSGLVRKAIDDHEVSDEEALEITRKLRELRAKERELEIMLEKYR